MGFIPSGRHRRWPSGNTDTRAACSQRGQPMRRGINFFSSVWTGSFFSVEAARWGDAEGGRRTQQHGCPLARPDTSSAWRFAGGLKRTSERRRVRRDPECMCIIRERGAGRGASAQSCRRSTTGALPWRVLFGYPACISHLYPPVSHRILGIPLCPCIDLYLYLAIYLQQIHRVPPYPYPTVSSYIYMISVRSVRSIF